MANIHFRNWLIEQCSKEKEFDLDEIILRQAEWGIDEFCEALKNKTKCEKITYTYNWETNIFSVKWC